MAQMVGSGIHKPHRSWGDDASWIDKGTDELGFSVRQLDGFHLARACRKGWKQGADMYDAIRGVGP